MTGAGADTPSMLGEPSDAVVYPTGHVFPEFKESDAMFAAERVSWEWVCAVGQSVCPGPPPETSTLYSPCTWCPAAVQGGQEQFSLKLPDGQGRADQGRELV